MQDVQKTSCTLLAVFCEGRFVPGGASRVPAGRKLLRCISRHGNTHRKQTRCAKLPFAKAGPRRRNPFCFQKN
jgi:hypothetical protein